MKNKYKFGVYLAAFHHSAEDVTVWITSLRTLDSKMGGSIIIYTMKNNLILAGGWSKWHTGLLPILSISLKSKTDSFSLDLLCHKATWNANQEINHTDDKRDEKEEEEVQSLMLSTCSFELSWLNFSLRREFIHIWSALSAVIPSWWALWCDIWRIWEYGRNKKKTNRGKPT